MVTPARRILIGVHVTAAGQGLAATLRSLFETVSQPFELAVLADPMPDEAVRLGGELAELIGIRQLASAGSGGAAASFNRLVAEDADVYVFVECGVRPGRGWLTHLLEALDADPAHGLAGPSANWCWNEQGVAPGCGASAPEVERQARTMAWTHKDAWRPMAPLHSLGDFCLAVRHEVVAAIGAADVAYGRGPCWEMDYGVRAARAGFDGVWVKAAFVHRAPPSAQRRNSEPALLEANKHLYQDRFCGRRVDRPGAPYHAHCRGEACADFAPKGSIRLHLDLAALAPGGDAQPNTPPLISCIMPTRGRPRYVAQAIAYFRRQDYPNRELIIVHDGPDDLPGDIAGDDIRIVRATETSIGGKRNDGVRAAQGEIIVHWDDDDWYGESRLSRQAAPILHGVADVTGLNDFLFLAVPSGEFWSVSAELFARMYVENVSGGTLMFRRRIWDESGPYPEISLREDAEFLMQAMRRGARLCRLSGHDLHLYLRHDCNTWKFQEGSFLQQSEWHREAEPDFLKSDRSFYLGGGVRTLTVSSQNALVSCIMPTANRRAFVRRAIQCFLAQDHPAKELIVLDDGQDSVADLMPRLDCVRYVRTERHATLGAKRNAACALARGEIIAHWDDDDWMAPQWLRSQVETLGRANADVCGLDKVFFYAPDTRQAWRYVYGGPQPWVCGGTLCYTVELWRRNRFAEITVGEDNGFVWSQQPKRMAINERGDLYIATVHARNTSPKITASPYWHAVPAAHLERLLNPADREMAQA